MTKFSNKDIKDIIALLDEQIDLKEQRKRFKLGYSETPSTKQSKDAEDYVQSHGIDSGIDKAASDIQSAYGDIKSKLGKFKRIKGNDNVNTSSKSQSNASKFKEVQGGREFKIEWSAIDNGSSAVNLTADNKNATLQASGGASGKFKPLEVSNNALKCEGTGGQTDNNFWLISFTNEVENAQNNNGKITLLEDRAGNIRSNTIDWAGKITT